MEPAYNYSCSQIAPFEGLTPLRTGRILPVLSGRGCSPPEGSQGNHAHTSSSATSLSCRKTFEETVSSTPGEFSIAESS